MDKLDRQTQFLEVYRQQLRRELDEMGYGQPKGDVTIREPQSRRSLGSSLTIIAVALAVLGVISAQS